LGGVGEPVALAAGLLVERFDRIVIGELQFLGGLVTGGGVFFQGLQQNGLQAAGKL